MRKLLLIIGASLFLAACGGGGRVATQAPPPVDGERVKIGAPYKIAGVWYTPAYDPDYEEVGMASWYGPNFHGKPTANGERFDMNQLTAAHRTLPLPSYVKVTNMTNRRSIILRVNDRGPFARGRIIDVSRRAAQLLGFESKGVERVRVEIVNPDGSSYDRGSDAVRIANAAGASIPGMLYVQIGSFAERSNANSLVRSLGNLGTVFVQPIETNRGMFYRVRLGPFADRDDAEDALRGVRRAGYREARIFTEPVNGG